MEAKGILKDLWTRTCLIMSGIEERYVRLGLISYTQLACSILTENSKIFRYMIWSKYEGVVYCSIKYTKKALFTIITPFPRISEKEGKW